MNFDVVSMKSQELSINSGESNYGIVEVEVFEIKKK